MFNELTSNLSQWLDRFHTLNQLMIEEHIFSPTAYGMNSEHRTTIIRFLEENSKASL